MRFFAPEQMNSVRHSIRDGEWLQSVKTATAPLRGSLRRIRRSIFDRIRRIPVSRTFRHVGPSPLPIFSADILPLFVSKVKDLKVVTGLAGLLSDVDKQMLGEYRLAGSGYQRVKLNGDDQFSEIEDHHALERLYWAARYSRAAAFGHPDAAVALRCCWMKWLQIPKGAIATAPYTVAERIASLSECLFWMAQRVGELDTVEIISMKHQIRKDAHLLSSNIEYSLGLHNHLLNDARGLFRASRVLADIKEAKAWKKQAFRIWDEYFPKLILADGSFAEQSSHYQILLCRTALEYYLAARFSHRNLPDQLEEQISQMFQLANDLVRPDGSFPRFGDSSPDHTADDLSGLLSASYHYGLLKERPRHTAISPLTLLYCGEAPRIPEAVATSRQNTYPHGGYMFLRSKDEAVDLAVHADPRPSALAHGDSGRGSFELVWRGQVLVREPGSILSSSNPHSEWSRSGLSQNVTCLNGLAPAVTSEDRKFLPASYANQGGAWVAYGEREITFRWDGFRRIRPDVAVTRTWRLDSSDDLLLEENICGSGEVHFESRLYLGGNQWKVTCTDTQRRTALQITGPDNLSVILQMELPLGVSLAIEEGRYFTEFGVERSTLVVVLRGDVTLPVCWKMMWQFCFATVQIAPELSQQCVA